MYAPFHAKNPLKGHVVLVDLGANWSVPWNPFHSFQIKYPLSRVLIGSLFLRFVLYLLYSVVQSSGSHFWRRSGSLHQAFPSLGNIRAFDHIGILEVRMLNKWVGNSEKIAWVAPTANPKKRLTCVYDSNQNENTKWSNFATTNVPEPIWFAGIWSWKVQGARFGPSL